MLKQNQWRFYTHKKPVTVGADINMPDKEGQTPLYICVQNAIVHSSYAAVEELLRAGASIYM